MAPSDLSWVPLRETYNISCFQYPLVILSLSLWIWIFCNSLYRFGWCVPSPHGLEIAPRRWPLISIAHVDSLHRDLSTFLSFFPICCWPQAAASIIAIAAPHMAILVVQLKAWLMPLSRASRQPAVLKGHGLPDGEHRGHGVQFAPHSFGLWQDKRVNASSRNIYG